MTTLLPPNPDDARCRECGSAFVRWKSLWTAVVLDTTGELLPDTDHERCQVLVCMTCRIILLAPRGPE